jgi:uncharacterized SAM-binding protein YcdF (DUF218 family)
MRRVVAYAAAAVAIVVAVILSRSVWLVWPGGWLVVNEHPLRSDVIVVPSGHTSWRISKATKLFHDGYASALFTTASGDLDETLLAMGMRITDTDVVEHMLVRKSIPREAITVVAGGTSTYTDALAFREYARTKRVRSAILVTSHLHSRRARWTYERVLPQTLRLTVIDADQPEFSVDRWWQSENGLLDVVAEYLKLGFYLTHYRRID